MAPTHFIGIDPTAGARPMDVAVLNVDLRPSLAKGALGDVLAAAAGAGRPGAVVAVDAPQSLNAGLMARADYRAALTPPPAPGRWKNYKVCEYQLKRRGIGLYNTPLDPAQAPAWMVTGFELYAALREAGFTPYVPGSDAPRQVLEVHPHACFTVMLGRLPLPKLTLEGRMQRQLILYRAGVEVKHPMDTLEELTDGHLLRGRVDLPGLLDHDALDALAAAYTAYLAAVEPERVTLLGDPEEGQIVLPVPPEELRDAYTR